MLRWPSVEGSILPLGVTWVEEERAFNFSIYSENAERVSLLLYSPGDLAVPAIVYVFDPRLNKTTHVWHCRLKESEMNGAVFYAYEVDGPVPSPPRNWHAFNPEKVLLDPYARAVYFPPGFDRTAALGAGPNAGKAPLGMLLRGETPFDWGDDRPPRHDAEAVVYEMHVRGFTMSPSSGVDDEARGTYAGVIAKIPYLKELGVTVVELLPVHQFDPQEDNYWGYMTLNFFAPHQQYAANHVRVRDEFRAMVKALHAADIEVILDVVYNHTAEGDHTGPTYCYKGIDNSIHYMMSGDPSNPYLNFSGTGNAVNADCGYVRTMILDSLRYWAIEMRVDGFRFDLASVLTRRSDGSVYGTDVPLLTAIRTDPVLRNVHLIAEPWDAGGAYQLGTTFPGELWHQWNGVFRDDVRRFVRGDEGMVPSLMRRLYGSDDIFPDNLHDARRPYQSVNYVTCHDGFTLYDLVSYDHKHNLANGQNNTDGTDSNFSWNCGKEGDDGLPSQVLALRVRQAKNFCALLLLSNGVPMFAAGDEFLQTQGGNNNPYNQDNATTWLDWTRLDRYPDVFRFFKWMIAFRKAHPTVGRSRFWREDVRWFGVGQFVDTSHTSHTLAYALNGASVGDCDLYVMINAWHEPLVFEVRKGSAGEWRRVVDTGLESPLDIAEPGTEEVVPGTTYRVGARSVVVLMRPPL